MNNNEKLTINVDKSHFHEAYKTVKARTLITYANFNNLIRKCRIIMTAHTITIIEMRLNYNNNYYIIIK